MIFNVYALVLAAALIRAVMDARGLLKQRIRADAAAYLFAVTLAFGAMLSLYFAPRDFSLIEILSRFVGIY